MNSDKLNAWTNLLSKLTWLVVVLIVAATVGKWLLSRQAPTTERLTKPVPAPPIDWRQIDQEIVASLTRARAAAETSATQKLEVWVDDLMYRVDEDFLEWYFDYWNQQALGLKALGYAALDMIYEDEPKAAELITEEIQEEFAQRVLRPRIAQLELERMTNEVLEIYLGQLTRDLATIPEEYKIPQPEWERYLGDIAVLTSGIEGNREIPLTLKAATAFTVGGGVMLTQALSPAIKGLGGKVSGQLAGKAAGEMASKTGAKVAAKSGGKFLGVIIGFGIVIWEAWDHYQTVAVERPKLRATIADYLKEVKQSLLHEPESGIMSIIHTMEGNMIASLRTKPAN